jgi:hypothetical protein
MKRLTSIFLAISIVLLSSTAFAVTLAWDKYTTSDGVAPLGYYIYLYPGTYVPNNHSTATKYDAGLPATTPLNEYSINITFTVNQKYTFVATAWAHDSDGVTVMESLESNSVEYIFRGDGLNNPPGTIPAPTGLDVLDQNTLKWVVGSIGQGMPTPVGYRIYYWVKSTPSTQGTFEVMGNVSQADISGINFTPNVVYSIKVVALVYDVNGISFKESTASGIVDYSRVSGPTGTPSQPKGLKIKQ